MALKALKILGSTNFAQEKFCVLFPKRMEYLGGIPSDGICSPKFIRGNFFPTPDVTQPLSLQSGLAVEGTPLSKRNFHSHRFFWHGFISSAFLCVFVIVCVQGTLYPRDTPSPVRTNVFPPLALSHPYYHQQQTTK